jgi:hypothetical protein
MWLHPLVPSRRLIVHTCAQCGAAYQRDDDSCGGRFSALLARDHSRQEPWGSRHGSAFAAYTLQHPAGVSREALERCWVMLYRIHFAGDEPAYVARTLRQANDGNRSTWHVPPLPAETGRSRQYRVTIADLGDFGAESYARQLEDWCRATLEALGQTSTPA